MIRRSQLDMSLAAASGIRTADSRRKNGKRECHDEMRGRKMHQAFFHWNVLSSRSFPGLQSPHGLRAGGPDSVKSSHVCLSSRRRRPRRQNLAGFSKRPGETHVFLSCNIFFVKKTVSVFLDRQRGGFGKSSTKMKRGAE